MDWLLSFGLVLQSALSSDNELQLERLAVERIPGRSTVYRIMRRHKFQSAPPKASIQPSCTVTLNLVATTDTAQGSATRTPHSIVQYLAGKVTVQTTKTFVVAEITHYTNIVRARRPLVQRNPIGFWQAWFWLELSPALALVFEYAPR